MHTVYLCSVQNARGYVYIRPSSEKSLILKVPANVLENVTIGIIPATFTLCNCTTQILHLEVHTSHVFWNVKFQLYFNFFSRLQMQHNGTSRISETEQPQNYNLPTYADLSQALKEIIDKIAASIKQSHLTLRMCFISGCWKNQR